MTSLLGTPADAAGQLWLHLLEKVGSAMRLRLCLIVSLRSSGRVCLIGLVALLLGRALIPAMVALATGASIQAVQASRSSSAWILPLVLLCLLFLAGQAADLFGGAMQMLAVRRIDGGRRRELSDRGAAAELVALEEQPVRDDLLVASRRPGNWTERTPGQAAVAQLRLCLRAVQALSLALVIARSSWWWLALSLLAVVTVVRSVLNNNLLTMAKAFVAGVPAARRAVYWRQRAVDAGAAKEIRLLGLGTWIVAQWRESVLADAEPAWRARVRLSWQQSWLYAVIGLVVAGGLVLLGLAVGNGELALGGVSATITATIGLVMLAAADDDAVSVASGAPVVAADERLRARLLPVNCRVDDRAIRTTRAAEPPLIRFEGVSFRYRGASRPALDECHLDIRPGEVLAVVGLNGAGKTTLTKLLTGLYRPDSGLVTADGVDIATLPPELWRRRFAVVLQDFVKYQLTAADNVHLGAPHAPFEMEALTAVSGRAGSEALFDRLPGGWGTVLSSSFTGGVDLSGGQWQHVALTRALFALQNGAQVLVLDEPTAHLDVRTELEMFRRVVHGLKNLSIVLISHRLSTVHHADRIVCIRDGRIVETGSHQQLTALGGYYATMFAGQANSTGTISDYGM